MLFMLFLFLYFISVFKVVDKDVDMLVQNACDQSTINWTHYPIIDKQNKNLIMILAEARSGSSFLGLYRLV